MLRVCFPWSQENLSPWYSSCYEFPHPQPTRSWSCNKSSSQSMVMESALCRPYQGIDMPSSHHSIIVRLIPRVPLNQGFGFWLSLLKKKSLCFETVVCWNNVPNNQLNSGHSLFFHNAFSGWSFLCFLMKGVFWLCAQQILLANPAKYDGEIS